MELQQLLDKSQDTDIIKVSIKLNEFRITHIPDYFLNRKWRYSRYTNYMSGSCTKQEIYNIIVKMDVVERVSQQPRAKAQLERILKEG